MAETLIIRSSPKFEVSPMLLTDGVTYKEIGIVYNDAIPIMIERGLIREMPLYDQIKKLKKEWISTEAKNYEFIVEKKLISLTNPSDLPVTPEGIALKHIKVIRRYLKIKAYLDDAHDVKWIAGELDMTYTQVSYAIKAYQELIVKHPSYINIKPKDI